MKIWDYIDPDKAENEIKENIELEIPLIAAALIAPVTPIAVLIILVTALTAPAAAPAILVIDPTTPAAILASTGITILALLD